MDADHPAADGISMGESFSLNNVLYILHIYFENGKC